MFSWNAVWRGGGPLGEEDFFLPSFLPFFLSFRNDRWTPSRRLERWAVVGLLVFWDLLHFLVAISGVCEVTQDLRLMPIFGWRVFELGSGVQISKLAFGRCAELVRRLGSILKFGHPTPFRCCLRWSVTIPN